MEQTLHQLVGILLKAIPTFIIVIILHIYLKAMLFSPLSKVLAERDKLTAGARKQAEESFALAEQKAAAYEEAIRQTRGEMYKEQELIRRQSLDEQAAQLAEARKKSQALVDSAKQEVSEEAATAKQTLLETSAQLADQIAESILAGSAR